MGRFCHSRCTGQGHDSDRGGGLGAGAGAIGKQCSDGGLERVTRGVGMFDPGQNEVVQVTRGAHHVEWQCRLFIGEEALAVVGYAALQRAQRVADKQAPEAQTAEQHRDGPICAVAFKQR